VDAIVPDTDLEPGDPWLHLNAELAKTFTNIVEAGDPPADAAEWKDVPNKLALLDKG